MFKDKTTFVFLLLVLNLNLVTGWWEVGHMTVARIAQRYLTDTEQTAALEKFTTLIKAFQNMTDGRSNTFVEAACWPDDIKEYNATFFDDYHFTDIVYDPQNLFVGMSQYNKDVNSINVASSTVSVLKTNKQGITFERAFMARFLLHLAGDIHQPLHSVSMYNNSMKTGDLGGNKIHITVEQNHTMNLHAYLDSMAGEQKDGVRMERPLTESGKSYINSLAGSIIKQFPPEYFGDKIQIMSPHTWAVQSYNAAVEHVYPFVFVNNTVTPEWAKQISTLCRERVALGGYRLALLIASIYK